VPKAEISLVGHGFSRAKTLVSKRFANLKVCPTQKIMFFGTVLADSELALSPSRALWFILCVSGFTALGSLRLCVIIFLGYSGVRVFGVFDG